MKRQKDTRRPCALCGLPASFNALYNGRVVNSCMEHVDWEFSDGTRRSAVEVFRDRSLALPADAVPVVHFPLVTSGYRPLTGTGY